MTSRHNRFGWGVVALVAVLPSGDGAICGQAPVRPWTAPKTPWDHPDLQGLWSNGTTTPLERPEELKDKARS